MKIDFGQNTRKHFIYGVMRWDVTRIQSESFKIIIYILLAMHPSGEDCTHFCNHALVWDTVWQGLRLAMDQAFHGPVATLGTGFMDEK